MPKVVTSDVGSFAQAAVTVLNDNFQILEEAFENTLSRDGSSPNQMEADLDMNEHDVLNVNRIDVQSISINGSSEFNNTLEEMIEIKDQAEDARDVALGAAQTAQNAATDISNQIETIIPSSQLFEGDGVETTFDMGQPLTPVGVNVFISGVRQQSDQYSLVGTSVIFTTPPPASPTPGDENIEIIAGAQASIAASGVPGAGTVGTPQLVDDSVTTPKIADGAVTPDKLSPAVSDLIAAGGTVALDTFAELEAEDLTGKSYVLVAGRTAVGDGGMMLMRNLGGSAPTAGYPATIDAGGNNWQYTSTAGEVTPEMFGAVGDGVTNDRPAIQAAINYVYDRGGGIVKLSAKTYAINGTIDVWQRCYLNGSGYAFQNQYSSTLAQPLGSVIYLLTGSNQDLIRFRMRVYVSGGVLYEVGSNRMIQGSYYRHHGGAHGIIAWGNRDQSGASPVLQSRNTLGAGFKVDGCHYIRIFNCCAMFCGDEGFYIRSFDYGLGTASSNNIELLNTASLSNVSHGYYLFGGDSHFHGLVAGFNGNRGIYHGMSGTLTGCLSWNNLKEGIRVTGSTARSGLSVTGNHSYDNMYSGFVLDGPGDLAVSGNSSRGNGRAGSSIAVTERCNFRVLAGARGVSLSGNTSLATDYLGDDITYYGYLINNPTYKVGFSGNTSRLCTVNRSVQVLGNLIAPDQVA